MLEIGQKVIIKDVQPRERTWWTNQMYQFCGRITHVVKRKTALHQSQNAYELYGISSKGKIPFTFMEEDLMEVK